MKPWVVVLVVLLSCFDNPVFSQEREETDLAALFHRGNEAYQRGEYAKAVQEYQAAVDRGLESGQLHYNLGNSYFREGNLAAAVYHFRKAQELLPRDADIAFNLKYARERTKDKIEVSPNLWDFFRGYILAFSAREGFWGLLFSSLMLFLLSAWLLFRPHDAIRWVRRGVLLAFVFSLFCLAERELFTAPFGVVGSPEVKVYSGTGKDNVLLFALHEGTEIDLLDQSDPKWVHIRVSDGKQGWIQKSNLFLHQNDPQPGKNGQPLY